MTTVLFDTLEAAKKLEGAGFNPAQTEVLVQTIHHAVNENVATKADLKELGTTTEAAIKALGTKIETDLKELEHKLRQEIAQMENRLTWRVGVMHAVAIAAILAGTQILITLNGLGS